MTWRQNVRSAERKGVIIREAENDADFDAYYNLLKITSERDAFFIHDKDTGIAYLVFPNRSKRVVWLSRQMSQSQRNLSPSQQR